MDDGAADGKQLRLNTQGFTRDEAEGLAGLIRAKFGVSMAINQDKGRPRLRCGAAGMPRLVGSAAYAAEYAIQTLPVTTSRLADEGWALCAARANLRRS